MSCQQSHRFFSRRRTLLSIVSMRSGFYKKGGVPLWGGGPPTSGTFFPGLALASACCAKETSLLPWDYENCDFALWKKRDAAMCGDGVARVHARWSPWHPNFFFGAIARVCPRRRKPLITTGENHTLQPPVAILNAAAVIVNRLSLDNNSGARRWISAAGRLRRRKRSSRVS